MAMGSGLLVLALMAADGPSCTADETTTYQVRVLTIDGLDWRTKSYSRLTPVTRQGTSAIWTADRSLAMSLAEKASSVTGCSKVIAMGEAVLSQAEPVNYVAAMDRVADGPINQSTAIAFMPRPERIDERFAVRLAGRKLDQGVLTRVTLEETHVDAMHTVKQTEFLTKSTRVFASGPDIVTTSFSPRTSENPASLTTLVQIPEVSQTRIDGEWIIPKDGVLLISLGVKTAADDNGKAVVRERVAVIEANPAAEPAAWSNGVAQPPIKTSKLEMPPTPTRALPRQVDASGAVIDLPPLPESVASADLDQIKPEPNQPSPQTRFIPKPEEDAALARTSYDAAPPAPNPPLVEVSDTTVNARLARLKTLQEALAKAGFDLDIDVQRTESTDLKPVKSVCEMCDGDSLFCPADARALTPAEPAGGIKLVREKPASIGLSIKDAQGFQYFDSVVKLEEALKTPGKTETTTIPLGGHVSLEIKATLVPTAKTTARKDKAVNAN